MTEDQVKDLTERLERAGRELNDLAARQEPFSMGASNRLHGKAQGVALALSYLKEYQ